MVTSQDEWVFGVCESCYTQLKILFPGLDVFSWYFEFNAETFYKQYILESSHGLTHQNRTLCKVE